jgi:hypothetical protein
MTSDETRRFTDREVALVLRKASELEESDGAGAGGGLSLADLEEIGAEVGISAGALRRAVADLDSRAGGNPFAKGQLVNQAIRAVEGELSKDAIAELIRHVDGTSDQVGVVTEALGSVQWTAQERLRTTQVSITPSEKETRIRVVERATARLRRLLTVAPVMTGSALVAVMIGQFDPSSGMVALFTAFGGAAGALVGRFLWAHMSNESRKRVKELASGLAREADTTSAGKEDEGGQ